MNTVDPVENPFNVCVVGGAGYVGLVTGVGLAAMGHQVTCVDVNGKVVSGLQSGVAPIHEAGLADLLEACAGTGRIRFTTELGDAVRDANIVFIAVGTPSQVDGHADLSQVIRVAEDLAGWITDYVVVVVKSTVPVGTVELVRGILTRRLQEGRDFDIVANPEFLREGKALADFFHPDRIVIGTASDRAREIIEALYAPILSRQVPAPSVPSRNSDSDSSDSVALVATDLSSAQMIKYAANSFLAMRISFINEIAALCERVGADVREVARGLGYDPRIGPAYLEAGLGFGGPCLEKDLRALIKIGEDTQYEPRLLRAILDRNEQQLRELLAKIKQAVGYLLYRRIVAVFGLAFKAGTNDVRNSVALRLITELGREGAIIRAYDPLADGAVAEAGSPEYPGDPYAAVQGADVLVVATDWPEFKELDFQRIRAAMARPCIVDGRNLLDASSLRTLGFQYVGVGVR